MSTGYQFSPEEGENIKWKLPLETTLRDGGNLFIYSKV